MVCQDHLILDDLIYFVYFYFIYVFISFIPFSIFIILKNAFKLRDKLKLLQVRRLVTKMGGEGGKGTEIGMENQIVLK